MIHHVLLAGATGALEDLDAGRVRDPAHARVRLPMRAHGEALQRTRATDR